MAYFTSSSDNKIYKIDGSVVTAHSSFNSTPYRIMSSPDRSTVYSVHPKGNTFSISVGSSITYLGVGKYPTDFALAKNGVLAYILNSEGESITTIDTSLKKVNSTLSGIGDGSVGIAVNHGNNYLHITFANYNNNGYFDTHLLSIDLNNLGKKKKLDLGRDVMPGKLVISPDDAYAYICCSGTNSVAVVNLASFTKVADIKVQANPLDIVMSSDGQYIYVTNHSSNTVSLINRLNNAVEANIVVGKNPQGLALSNDQKYLYVVNPADYTVSKVDIASRKEIQKISTSKAFPVWVATGK